VQEFLPETLPRMLGFGFESRPPDFQLWLPHWLFVLILIIALQLTFKRPTCPACQTCTTDGPPAP
jgi:hypothetical protein